VAVAIDLVAGVSSGRIGQAATPDPVVQDKEVVENNGGQESGRAAAECPIGRSSAAVAIAPGVPVAAAM